MLKNLSLASVLTLMAVACGGSGGSEVEADGGGQSGDAGLVSLCEPTCEGSDVCVDGVCCADRQACGDTCCGDGTVCSFGACVVPGDDCYDNSSCSDSDFCDSTLGEDDTEPSATCVGSTAPLPGKCLPKPPLCAENDTASDLESCLIECEYIPENTAFAPEVKYQWGDVDALPKIDNVMMTPIVVQLDDDNCDDVINERDIPEIIFTSFSWDTTTGGYRSYSTNGRVHAISIIEGEVVEKWTVDTRGINPSVRPGAAIAGGNFDGQPGNEVVVCLTSGAMRALRGSDGSEIWTTAPLGCQNPTISDLDQDGNAEILVGRSVVDGLTGTVEFAVTNIGDKLVGYDVNEDGQLEIVGTHGVADASGATLAQFRLRDGSVADAGRLAIGDFDLDTVPEIVVAEPNQHLLHVYQYDAAAADGYRVIRERVDINGDIDPSRCREGSAGRTRGGGPPTVADTNGDGFPDVAMAGGVGYTVFDGEKLMDQTVANADTIMWAKPTQDCSSAQTGSSVFDFDGDGRAEVVYADEVKLHIYNGETGEDLFETCNTSGTLTEYPVVADVDSDGRADIVVVSNNYASASLNCEDGSATTGIRVLGDISGEWVRTRTIWNQHAYHVTNVLENGDIPRIEKSNHLDPDLNNFRLNVQPQGEFSAPDLRAELYVNCGNGDATVRVRNFGEAHAPAGVPVSLYAVDGDERILIPGGPYVTERPLYPAEAEDIFIPNADDVPRDALMQAVVDESPEDHTWQECRQVNNASQLVVAACLVE